jgi:uncharacterized membrane protein YeaQ/YmgE (transglycosylase-associated protein family)
MGAFFLWLVLGAIAGWAAGKIMRGGFGLVGNIIVGINGGWVFGFGVGTAVCRILPINCRGHFSGNVCSP